MKIHPDHIQALTQQETNRVKSKTDPAEAFEDMLAQEVEKGGTSAGTTATDTTQVSGLAATEAVSGTQPTAATEQELMEHMDSLLDKWENYAQRLQDPADTDALKPAYSMLERISSDVEQLKESVPDLASQNTDLSNMVEELEIMAVTEKIKFNRGDYI